MRIVEVTKVEDCFDGSSVLRYRFDTSWSQETVLRLRTLGELDYFPEFPRPFFRLRAHSGLQVKGVEGEPSCQAVFPSKNRGEIQSEFEGLFEVEP